MLDQGDTALAIEADEEDEDAEDNEIRPTDSILVVATTEDEFSHLEVQLLSEDGNMFVHHDIALPEFPLCLAWLDCPPFQTDGGQLAIGNYIAVGSFDPAIEIWNLDVLDPLEPSAVLGGVVEEKKYLKKGSKKGKIQQHLSVGSHEDAVMGLSWNKKYRQAIASGSADKTVKIWDVTTRACQHTFTHHTDKVQSVAWHYDEAWLLASGSFDRTVALLDCRTGARASAYRISADIESMVWDPFCPFHLYCALESGEVTCIDIRHPGASVCTFQAHNKTASSISFSSGVPGMLATASIDKTVKIWDVASIQAASGSGGATGGSVEPRMIMYKTMNVGKLFTMQYFHDDPFMLATAGDKGSVAVWESDESDILREHFQSRVVARAGEADGDGEGAGRPSASGQLSAALAHPGHSESVTAIGAQAAALEDDSWMDEPEPSEPSQAKGKATGKKKSKDKKKK
jgi:periodic tryptophan protein 1